MQVDVLIIGQGISGTWLSYYLQKAGLSFIVIDEQNENAASRLAAGIINPVTGRRIVKTWMIDELLPFVNKAYQKMGEGLQTPIISNKNLVDFFPSPQMKLAFDNRYSEEAQYLKKPFDESQWGVHFSYDFGFGEIDPVYLVDIQKMLLLNRKLLAGTGRLREENFEHSRLEQKHEGIVYNDIEATKIVFCDGVSSYQNQWFRNLPFAPNKGEVLLIEAPDLPTHTIFKKNITLTPWSPGIFWVGSSYEWDFQTTLPTEAFREKTMTQLKHWLKVPFTVVDHKAGVRPATIERRPFVGFHPRHPAIGILNGMGTKGCSLAPYFANQLVMYLKNQRPINGEADVSRFARILSR